MVLQANMNIHLGYTLGSPLRSSCVSFCVGFCVVSIFIALREIYMKPGKSHDFSVIPQISGTPAKGFMQVCKDYNIMNSDN